MGTVCIDQDVPALEVVNLKDLNSKGRGTQTPEQSQAQVDPPPPEPQLQPPYSMDPQIR
jgi:hypothetical protein